MRACSRCRCAPCSVSVLQGGCDACGFGLPVGDQRGRQHHERGPGPAARPAVRRADGPAPARSCPGPCRRPGCRRGRARAGTAARPGPAAGTARNVQAAGRRVASTGGGVPASRRRRVSAARPAVALHLPGRLRADRQGTRGLRVGIRPSAQQLRCRCASQVRQADRLAGVRRTLRVGQQVHHRTDDGLQRRGRRLDVAAAGRAQPHDRGRPPIAAISRASSQRASRLIRSASSGDEIEQSHRRPRRRGSASTSPRGAAGAARRKAAPSAPAYAEFDGFAPRFRRPPRRR